MVSKTIIISRLTSTIDLFIFLFFLNVQRQKVFKPTENRFLWKSFIRLRLYPKLEKKTIKISATAIEVFFFFLFHSKMICHLDLATLERIDLPQACQEENHELKNSFLVKKKIIIETRDKRKWIRVYRLPLIRVYYRPHGNIFEKKKKNPTWR